MTAEAQTASQNPFTVGQRIVWAADDPRPKNVRKFGAHPREEYGDGPFVVDGVEPAKVSSEGVRSPDDVAQVQILVTCPARKYIREQPTVERRSFSVRWFTSTSRGGRCGG